MAEEFQPGTFGPQGFVQPNTIEQGLRGRGLPVQNFEPNQTLVAESLPEGRRNSNSSLVGASSMQNFVSSVAAYGVAKDNRYLMVMNHPTPNASNVYLAENLLRFYCHTVTMPSYDVMTIGTRVQGNNVEMPYDFTRGGNTFNVGFYMDKKFLAHGYFTSWLNHMMDRTSYQYGYYDEYTTQIELLFVDYDITNKDDIKKQWNKTPYKQFADSLVSKFRQSGELDAAVTDIPVLTTTFINAYPKRISEVSMSASGKDFINVTVEFSFEKATEKYSDHIFVEKIQGGTTFDNSVWGRFKSQTFGSLGGLSINTADSIGKAFKTQLF